MATSMSGTDTGNQPGKLSRALVDANVVLDLVLAREPWATHAKPLWDARDAGRIDLCLPASVLTDVFYICRKQIGADKAKQAVVECLLRFTILPVDRGLWEAALVLAGADFEDNVQIACAVATAMDFIVTRDPDGFAHAPIPVVAPLDLTTLLPAH